MLSPGMMARRAVISLASVMVVIAQDEASVLEYGKILVDQGCTIDFPDHVADPPPPPSSDDVRGRGLQESMIFDHRQLQSRGFEVVLANGYPQERMVSSYCPAGTVLSQHACGSGAENLMRGGGGSPDWGAF
eukprot:SAG11_NODE_18755_length_482_cov_0.939948_1_plen_131_part_01